MNPDINVFAQVRDLSQKQEAIEFGEAVLNRFSQVHLLVNNAGTFIPGDICTEEDGVLEKLISTNLYSAYHLTRVIVLGVIQNEIGKGTRGHIFNISSVAALQAYTNGGSYSISKYAMDGFSKNLREELKPHFIKVSTVNPGATMSDSWRGSNVDQSPDNEAAGYCRLIWTIFTLSPQAVVRKLFSDPNWVICS